APGCVEPGRVGDGVVGRRPEAVAQSIPHGWGAVRQPHCRMWAPGGRIVVSLTAEVPEPPGSDRVPPPGASSPEDAGGGGRTVPDPHASDSSWPDVAVVREARELLFARYIGPYHLTALLGEGGMGQVYLATQEQPLRREVALKVIKRGMDTDAIVARFASERRALALMDHPAIARVLDAGTTDD